MSNTKTDNRTKESKPKKRSKGINLLSLIFFIVFCFSAYKLVVWYFDNERTKNMNNEISTEIVKKVEVKREEKKNFNLDIDFKKLIDINQDIVGYIEIPNIIEGYPIVQGKDNEYYLDKDIYKKHNSCGSIFMDYNNNKFYSQNTVLYGHNMKSGLMFACINDILNNKHGNDFEINIYTPEKNIKYKPFAVYVEDPIKYPIETEPTDMQEFINKAIRRSYIKFSLTPNSNDKILTLSTCNRSGEKRAILHAAKLIEEVVN